MFVKHVKCGNRTAEVAQSTRKLFQHAEGSECKDMVVNFVLIKPVYSHDNCKLHCSLRWCSFFFFYCVIFPRNFQVKWEVVLSASGM